MRSLILLVLCSLPLAARADLDVVSPAAGTLTFAAAVDVDVALMPPLGAGETLEARLFSAVDATAPGALFAVDLGASIQLAPGGASAQVLGVPLAPGRNTLQVRRFAGGAKPVESVAHVIDREGFPGDQPGPFRAGVLSSQLTRPSSIDPAVARTLDLYVWYPSDDFAAPDDPPLGAALGVAVAPGVADLPAMLFSHGNCGIPYQSTFFTAGFAEHGSIVVAMAHTGNTALDPGCNALATQAESLLERPDDVIATLDWLLAENADPVSPLFGLVDSSRVSLSGHSFGGQTTYRTASVEPRLVAALPLAPEYAFTAPLFTSLLPLPVPTMVQGATLDGTTPFVEHQLGLYDELVAPRYLLEIFDTGHLAFTNFTSAADKALVNRFGFGFLGVHGRMDRRWAALLAPVPGVALTTDAPALPDPGVCANGLDDDGDGSVDGDDDGCSGPADASEAPSRNRAGHGLNFSDRSGDPGRRRLRVASRDPGFELPTADGPGDPTLAGAELELRNPATGEVAQLVLPAAGWSRVGSGLPPRAYRYRAPDPRAGCRAYVRDGRWRATCRGAELTFSLDEPSQGTLAVGLRLGSDPTECLSFGGTTHRDQPGRYRAVAAPAPSDCPLP